MKGFERKIFGTILLICHFALVESGCSPAAKSRVEEIGLPSFVIQSDATDCDCVSVGARFAKAELGLDPFRGDYPRKSGQELHAALEAEAKSIGSSITVRKVADYLDELAARPQPGPMKAALLVHPNGHRYVLLGTVIIGEVLTYQVVHGDSSVWLVDRDSLNKAGFDTVWQFQKVNEVIPVRIGESTLNTGQHYFNFGKVSPVSSLEGTIRLENKGPATLLFGKAEVTCRCTLADQLEGVELTPNGAQEFKVSFQTSAASSERHPVFLTVYEKGSGQSQRLEFLLLASQQESMVIEPQGIDFGSVVPGKKYVRTVNFSEVPTDRFSIMRFASNGNPTQGKFKTIGTREGLNIYQVEVEFVPDSQEPNYEKNSFTVETSSILRSKVQVPYTFKLLPEIYAEPSTIPLGSIDVGEKVTEKIQIRSRKGEDLQCEVPVVPEGCQVEVIHKGDLAEISISTVSFRLDAT